MTPNPSTRRPAARICRHCNIVETSPLLPGCHIDSDPRFPRPGGHEWDPLLCMVGACDAAIAGSTVDGPFCAAHLAEQHDLADLFDGETR